MFKHLQLYDCSPPFESSYSQGALVSCLQASNLPWLELGTTLEILQDRHCCTLGAGSGQSCASYNEAASTCRKSRVETNLLDHDMSNTMKGTYPTR